MPLLGAWSLGGDLNTGRSYLAGAGTETAGLSFGGTTGTSSAATEEYNGASWSTGGDLNTARAGLAGAGTQDSGLSFGGDSGSYTGATEEYNGASWSSGGSLSTARYRLAGCGTLLAGLSFGGQTDGTTLSAVTEEYNGTSWSAGGSLSTPTLGLAGAGTQTAGLSFGGFTTARVATTEEYNGTSWASGGNLNTAKSGLAGTGTQTAGLSFGGQDGSNSATTEEYNGTSWSSAGDLNTARQALAGAGTRDAGLSFGGDSWSPATEVYYGSIIEGSVSIAKTVHFTRSGTETSFTMDFSHAEEGDTLLCIIGKDDDTAMTTTPSGWTQILGYESNNNIYQEVWKREAGATETSYTWEGDSEEYAVVGLAISGVDYSTITVSTGAAGSGDNTPVANSLTIGSSDILVFSGITVDNSNLPHNIDHNLTDVFRNLQTTDGGSGSVGVSIGYTLFTTTGSVWTVGGDLSDVRYHGAGAGTQTAGLFFAGFNPPSMTNITEEYNGASWSSGGNVGTTRYYLAGAGTQTAGLCFGGWTGAFSSATEEYNGSTWSAEGNLSTARRMLAGAGTQTAGLSFGGDSGSISSVTEEYNGTSWSSGGSLNTARYLLAGAGTQTAGLSFGGQNDSVGFKVTEEYNGTSWSSGGDLSEEKSDLAGAGTSYADTLAIGGLLSGVTGDPPVSTVEQYNGTVWSSVRSIYRRTSGLSACGSSSGGLCFGGQYEYDTGTAGGSASTEEYSTIGSSTGTFDYIIESSDEWAAWSLYIESSAAGEVFFQNLTNAIMSGEKFHTAVQLNGVLVT